MIGLEIVVVSCNLIYVLLLIFQQRLGWLFGIVGSLLFVVGNIQQQLYLDATLNSYYVIAGIFGWYFWHDKASAFTIKKITATSFLTNLLAAIFVSFLVGFVFSIYTNNSLPYLDSAVTVLSFLATWMAAQKVLQNWFVWILADPLAMYLYYCKGGYWYPTLFAFYTVLAIYGYWQWKKQYQWQLKNEAHL